MQCSVCGKEGCILVDSVEASGSVYGAADDVIGSFTLSLSLNNGNKLCYPCIGKELGSMAESNPFSIVSDVSTTAPATAKQP